MSDNHVHFSSLTIKRFLGIGDTIDISGFSSGINIIHGPNGSGKSTCALAIQELLWPGQTGIHRPSVSGRYLYNKNTSSDGNNEWHIDIDAGHAQANENGHDCPLPHFGPPEMRERYRLVLHELFNATNDSFAEHILKESQGGYDSNAAAQQLGYSSKNNTQRSLIKNIAKARTAIMSAETKHKSLHNEYAELPLLKTQHDEAKTAGTRLQLLQKALLYQQAQIEVHSLSNELADYDPHIALLHGNERDQLDSFTSQNENLDESIANEQQSQQRLEQELSALALAASDISEQSICALRADIAELSILENDLRHQQQQHSHAQAAADQARSDIGPHAPTLNSAEFHGEIPDLTAFARSIHSINAEEQGLHKLYRWLKEDADDEIKNYNNAECTINLHSLQRGIETLGTWMNIPNGMPVDSHDNSSTTPNASQAASQTALYLTIVLLIALIIALTIIHHWLWLTALVAVIGIHLFSKRHAFNAHANSITAVIPPTLPDHDQARRETQTEYESYELPSPKTWTAADVKHALFGLIHQMAEHQADIHFTQNKNNFLKQLQADEVDIHTRRADCEQQRRDLETQLGVEITLDDYWLPTLVAAYIRWQTASNALDACSKTISVLQEQFTRIRKQLSATIDQHGADNVNTVEIKSASHASDILKTIEDKQQQRISLQQQITASTQRIENHRTQCKKTKAERAALMHRLFIPVNDVSDVRGVNDVMGADDHDHSESQIENHLNEWIANISSYRNKAQALSDARTRMKVHHDQIADDPDLHAKSIEHIEHDIERLRILVDRADTLLSRIKTIESNIDSAKQSHDISSLVATEDACKNALFEAIDDNAAAQIGDLLVQHLCTDLNNHSRPEVFRKANALLASFTHGSLHIELDERSKPPQFLAYDGSGKKRPVDQLSNGERVQVLMAIRVAFLEDNELSQLPLLLDEVLGTSDDSRVDCIIDTIIDIAKSGRQVFYFTAQEDEVGKWKGKLEASQNSDLDYTIIDLASVRNLSTSNARPLHIAPYSAVHIPPPVDGIDHRAYGELLQVPALPADKHSGMIHLWHIIEDCQLLYQLLSKHIHNWSQLQTLVDNGGTAFISDNEYACAHSLAQTIESAVRYHQIGRCLAIDRDALLQSKAVSASFIEKVATLTQQYHGNAADIIIALENGSVNRWHSANTEKLRDYCEANDYISNEAQLSDDDIRIRCLADMNADLAKNIMNTHSIDRIVASLSE